jgi:hypothetical protein
MSMPIHWFCHLTGLVKPIQIKLPSGCFE